MRLVVLIDNCTINGKNLKGEGGASYYIEDEDKKFLLDTGASGLFMENAKNLDINLDDIDTVVLSHGHYDHAGGIKDFIESRDDKINIICHPLSFNKKKKGNTNMGAPYRKDEIIKLANVNFSDKPVKVSKNITYLGQIPDIMDFENRKLMGEIEIDGKYKDDYIMDDSALLYENQDGIYIITGCSHSGICNIIEYAKKVSGKDKLLGIIGGTHLQEINEQLYKTIEYFKENILNKYSLNVTKIVEGGTERQDSVYNGLKSIEDTDTDIVLIHDGARPFISNKIIDDGIKYADVYGACAPGVMPKDTIKVKDSSNFSINTPNRANLVAIQTPQVFKFNEILECHEKIKTSNEIVTDDTMVAEKYGYKVYLYDGEYTNIKVTTPEDLILGEKLI